jgi:hypothetical protein
MNQITLMAKTESHYKRLQRFLGEFEMDYYSIARFVVKFDGHPSTLGIVLYLGQRHVSIEIFVVAKA